MRPVDTGRRPAGRSIDYGRWPALSPPPPAGLRGPAVRALIGRLADRCGVRIRWPDGRVDGPPTGPLLEVHRPRALIARLAGQGAIGFAESYLAAEWDAPDLVAVMEALISGMWSAVPRPLRGLRRLADQVPPPSEDNDRAGSRRNIARHYDLSNDLFALFLDETLTYSSALFERPGLTLADAQRAKIDRLLDRCQVGPGVRLLEIGSGWGGLALRAARRGAHVVTITLSDAQAGHVRDAVGGAGLGALVDVRVEDYRDVQGRYDAIVSVEMIEAVGPRHWDTFFGVLDARLAAGGRIGLQSILMEHDRMRSARRSWTWTQKYIFPGGLVPSERAIDAAVGSTRLTVVDRLRFGASYARTLAAWRARFAAAESEVAGLGFDHTFRRMWDFYLAQSEAGFRAGYLDVAQLILGRSDPRG